MATHDVETIHRLAPLQEGMLFHSLEGAAVGMYVEQAFCTLEGDLVPDVLRLAWERVVAHHPALRASFHWREVERAVQVVHRRVEVPWREEDWRPDAAGALEPAAEAARFDALVEAERRQGFDLDAPPLLRLTLVRVAGRRWRFLWTYHHLLLDGWSLLPVLRQVFDGYGALAAGREPALPPSRPYVDYVSWLRERDTPEARARDEDFWRRELAGFRAATPLPGALRARRPGGASTPDSRSGALLLPRERTAALSELARRIGVTPGTLVQAAWALLLARSSGEDDVVFGSVVSGRPAHLPGATSMVGMFINTLPVRVRVDEDEPLARWLRRLQERLVELREHEHSPLPRVRRWSDVAPGEPLFESLVAFENYPRDPGVWHRLGDLAVRDLRSLERTNYPLNLAVVPGEELYLELTFSPELFEPGAAERLLGQVSNLLAGMAADGDAAVGSLSLLSPEEERRVLLSWSGADAAAEAADAVAPDAPRATLHGLVAEQVRTAPDAVAVESCGGAEAWTYGALGAAAAAVAERLESVLGAGGEAAGERPEPLVAVLLGRSAEAYAAVLGVLQAGAGFLPLDPEIPDRRLLEVVADAKVSVVVTRRDLWSRLADRCEARPLFVEEVPREPAASALPATAVEPERTAYVIYTSGSTGRPKGVAVTHRSPAHLVRCAREHLELGPGSRVVQLSSLAFDAAVAEIFFALAAGGRVCPVDRETLLSPPALALALARSRAGVMLASPALLEALPAHDHAELDRIVSGADRCPPEVAARWSAGRRFSNDYGPTEATIYCVRHEGPGGPQGPPLGRPIPGARVYVLDRRLRPVPAGVPGEILLGGVPLARGYLDRPATTAGSFVPHPFGHLEGERRERGARLYRTGDLGRFLPDGSVEFVGRIDHQVKVRGHRVECGEVEAVLSRHPGVAAAAVVATGEAPHRRLAAFVVPRREAPAPDPEELRGWLARRLPEAMVPAVFEGLDELPLGATGKIDRRALAERSPGAAVSGGGRPPAPGVEATLAGIWGAVLEVEGVSADDDFFRLGGDSILAIRVISKAAEAGIELTPRRLFENPTVARLAAALRETGAAAPEAGGGVASEAAGPVPLTPVQRWFFELEPGDPHHWNLPVLLAAREPLDAGRLAGAVAGLRRHHDALRLVFERGEDGWRQRVAPPEEAGAEPFSVVDLSALPAAAYRPALRRQAATAQAALDLARGPLRAVHFPAPPGEADRLLLVVHHLAVDAVSWGLLLESLERLYGAAAAGGEVRLPPRTTPFSRWARELERRARSPEVEAELPLWRAHAAPAEDAAGLRFDGPGGPDREGAAETVSAELDSKTTEALLGNALGAYQSRPEELVLTALARSLAGPAPAAGGARRVTVLLEGHGRPDDVDLSRTVGWLTALYPARLELPRAGGAGSLADDVKAVKETLRSLPGRGLGYGLLRYLRPDLAGTRDLAGEPALAFNYLGRIDRAFSGASHFTFDDTPLDDTRAPRARRGTPVELNAYVQDGRLRLDWRFGPARIRRRTVAALAESHRADLEAVVAHCLDPEAGGFTPSDFPAAELDQEALDKLVQRITPPRGGRGVPPGRVSSDRES